MDKAFQRIVQENMSKYHITHFLLAENIPPEKMCLVYKMLTEGFETLPDGEDFAWYFDILSKYDKLPKEQHEFP